MNRPPMAPRTSAMPDSAEDWLARLMSPDSGAAEAEAFERWRAADPAHAAAYADVERIHRGAARLANDPLLRAAARAALRDTARTSRSRRHWVLAISLAASVLLAVGLLHRGGDVASGSQRYANGTGLPQSILLDDGTALQLDAESAVDVALGAQRRVVTLEQGRAQFAVAHDAKRPFEVLAGNSRIRDIGTIFQVNRRNDGVTVALLQGRVAVSGVDDTHRWSRDLRPAQQIHIAANGDVGAVAPLDVAAARGWPQGELAFRERRLDELVAQMNRYSTTRLKLGDPALARLRVSGSFHAGDQAALVKALERGWKLRAQRTGPHELTLLPAARQP